MRVGQKKVGQLVWTTADGTEERKDFGWVYLRADLLVDAKIEQLVVYLERSMVELWADVLDDLAAGDLAAAMAQ
eukprot:scaffold8859_cov169-Ochromonas_danica.AAC.10